MTALAVISALVTALCIGYHFGRRVGSTPSTWRKRTSRVALGRLAINLVVLMTARRIRQRFQAGRVFSDAGGIWGLRFIEPLGLLRGSVARLRSYLREPSSVDATNTFAQTPSPYPQVISCHLSSVSCNQNPRSRSSRLFLGRVRFPSAPSDSRSQACSTSSMPDWPHAGHDRCPPDWSCRCRWAHSWSALYWRHHDRFRCLGSLQRNPPEVHQARQSGFSRPSADRPRQYRHELAAANAANALSSAFIEQSIQLRRTNVDRGGLI